MPLLHLCLAALQKQTLVARAVQVVDNSSGGQCRLIGKEFPGVEVLVPGCNTGFAGGNNFALERCRTDFFVTLNPDTRPDPGWLEALVKAADAHPEAAAFGSLQVRAQDRKTVDGAGDNYHISGLFWREAHGRPLTAVSPQPEEIFSPCAAAALYRRAAIAAVGGFDEDFFCFGEDVDLGFRLRLAGHSCRLVPEAVVLHEGGTSSGGERSDFAVFHGHRNMVWVYVKNMPGPLFWLLLPMHLLANVVAVVVLAARGQGMVGLKAKTAALCGWPAMWRKRRVIQAARRVPPDAVWRAMSKTLFRS